MGKFAKEHMRGAAGVMLSVCMAASAVPVGLQLYSSTGIGAVTAYAAETLQDTGSGETTETQPLTTLWESAEVGTHTGTGSYSYDAAAGTLTVQGAGTRFDKDGGQDDLYFACMEAGGTLTVTAKMTVSGAGTGAAGILIKNSTDTANSAAAALYADLAKNQIRYGYHKDAAGGGASKLAPAGVTPASTVYVKLVADGEQAVYSVSSSGDFSDTATTVTKTQSGITGLNAKTIGVFATEGVTATFSDMTISSDGTDSDGNAVSHVLFDSRTGEWTAQHLTSADCGGSYDAGNTYQAVAEGNTLQVTQTRSTKVKGNIRTNTGMDYLLFPETDQDLTMTADVTVQALDSGTDKQGIAMGQFSMSAAGSVCDVLHIQKNKAVQHTFNTAAGAGNCGDPKNTIAMDTTYTMVYQKTGDQAVATVTAADGTVLIDHVSIPLSQDAAGVQAGQKVRYGFAFSGVTAEISNVTLRNSAGAILYDMNLYYKEAGKAPVIDTPAAAVASDRESIDLSWQVVTPGSGNEKYSVYVSYNGGAYTKAGDTKVNQFSYTNMQGDGTYSFQVVPFGGEAKGIAVQSADVTYQAPLQTVALTAAGTADAVQLSWTEAAGAEAYQVYRAYGSDGTFALLTSCAGTSYTDQDVKTEEPYYYYVTAVSASNTGNPSDTQQALTSDGHTGSYACEDQASVLKVISKSDDTVFSDTAELTLQTEETGQASLTLNGKVFSTVQAESGKDFSFQLTDLEQGRNDVELLFTNEAGTVTRKTFNFVSKPAISSIVDPSYTGAAGTETKLDADAVSSYPTYQTVQEAVDAVPADQASSWVIYIKNGEYDERVTVTSPYVSLLGQDSQKTHLFHSVAIAQGNADSMWNRNAMYVDSTAEGFTAENLTIENSYAYTNGTDQQADALCIVADRTACINVRIVGYQDTLLTDTRVKGADGNYLTTRQYFEKCYITGNVDFIYGAGTSCFEDCDIVARYTPYKADGCYSAGRTYAATSYGYVFDNCRFLAEEGVQDGAYRMGRPWGADDSTTFLNCYLGRAISTDGGVSYGDMSGNLAANARFAEYGSYGPGYVVSNTRPLLTSEQAAAFQTKNVMGSYSYDAFTDALYKLNTTPLDGAVQRATAVILANATSSKYTEESIRNLAELLSSLQGIDKLTMKQADVYTYTAKLLDAISQLVVRNQTEPATQPTQPATEPTQPATEPTQPATEPTQPATQPTQPVTEPTTQTTGATVQSQATETAASAKAQVEADTEQVTAATVTAAGTDAQVEADTTVVGDSADTGDHTSAAWYLFLLSVAGGGAVLLRKKQGHNREDA